MRMVRNRCLYTRVSRKGSEAFPWVNNPGIGGNGGFRQFKDSKGGERGGGAVGWLCEGMDGGSGECFGLEEGECFGLKEGELLGGG